nr:hypothetical protein [uncultured Shimia sp.]
MIAFTNTSQATASDAVACGDHIKGLSSVPISTAPPTPFDT